MSDSAEDIKKQIEQLQERLEEVKGKDDLEKRRLGDFKEMGTLLKTRNFFGVYNDYLDNFRIYIMKEGAGADEASEENAERVFLIADITKETLNKGETS